MCSYPDNFYEKKNGGDVEWKRSQDLFPVCLKLEINYNSSKPSVYFQVSELAFSLVVPFQCPHILNDLSLSYNREENGQFFHG